MFKIFDCFNNVTKERRPWAVRVVKRGEKYGRGDVLTHLKLDPLVEFHDLAYGIEKSQMVSRYYMSTLLSSNKSNGLDLQGDVPAWKIDQDSMRDIYNWLWRGPSMKCEVNGIKYKSRPVNATGNPCNGCAGQSSNTSGGPICHALGGCEQSESIIWVECKKKPTVKVNGITYKAIKEREAGLCVGCVAEDDWGLCGQIVRELSSESHCYEKQVVWAEKKPKVVEPVPEPIPEPVKTVAWVNMYPDHISAAHKTEQDANDRACADRITCVRIEY